MLLMPSYISSVHATPIVLGLLRRGILISQAVFSHKDANFPGQTILRHEGHATLAFNLKSTAPRSVLTPA
jgi:hypothetical protein